jgi:hypothetical protein
MRGIERTRMIRAYGSDADKMVSWCDALNAKSPKAKKQTTADVLRAICDENRRMKQRIEYLNIEMCRLAGMVSALNRDLKKCYR